MKKQYYQAIVIGVSAGGLKALGCILPNLPKHFSIPILIVQHISADSDNYLPLYFQPNCRVTVKEADDKESIVAGTIYFAPPNYHLLVEPDRTLALSTQERVNYARPSVDVLFESAADTYGKQLVGVILTGANNDGAKGLAKIKSCGGLAVVQDPATAEATSMPESALEATHVDHVMSLPGISTFINSLIE